MKWDCGDVEQLLSDYVENTLSEDEALNIRAHLKTCESCALRLLELEFTIALCKAYPELDPPPRLIARIVAETSGHSATLSLIEYLRELFRPLYASPRFATGFCLAAISVSMVMNALGLSVRGLRWSDLSVRNVVNSVNRSVNIAYDNGLRRLNDLKILYQIQSKIEELRTEDSEHKPQAKPKEHPLQNSAAEHQIAMFNHLPLAEPEL